MNRWSVERSSRDHTYHIKCGSMDIKGYKREEANDVCAFFNLIKADPNKVRQMDKILRGFYPRTK